MRQEQHFDYEVVAKLGVGMFGEVSKVRRKVDNKEFALKILKEDMVRKSPRILQMLSHEVTGLIGKYHPNMVTLYDAFKINDDNFLIYELCDPESMKTRLRSKGCWTEQNIIELAKSMVLALHYLHGLGIIHRDIKPDNILMRRGQYKLADFGLCYRGGHHYDNDLIGSPAYLAPEIFKRRFYSEKSDIYALGISLYEMYIGKYPFEQKHEQALIKRKSEFLPCKEVMKGASDAFINLLKMMVHPNFDKRASLNDLIKILNLNPNDPGLRINPDEDEFQIGNFGTAYAQIPVNDGMAHTYYEQSPQSYDELYSYQPKTPQIFEAYDKFVVTQQEPQLISNYGLRENMMGNQNLIYQQRQSNQYPVSIDNHQFLGSYPTSLPDNHYKDSSLPAQEDVKQSNYNNLFNVNMYDRVMTTRPRAVTATRSIFTDEEISQPSMNQYSKLRIDVSQRNVNVANSNASPRKDDGYSQFSKNINPSRMDHSPKAQTDRPSAMQALNSQQHPPNLLRVNSSANNRNHLASDQPARFMNIRTSSFVEPSTANQHAPSYNRAETMDLLLPNSKASDRSFSSQPFAGRSRKQEPIVRLAADPFAKAPHPLARNGTVEMPLAPKKDYNNLLRPNQGLPPKPFISASRTGQSSMSNLDNIEMHRKHENFQKYTRYMEGNSENTPVHAVNRSLTSEFSTSTNNTTYSGENSYQKAYTMMDSTPQHAQSRMRNILPSAYSNQQFNMAMLGNKAAQDEANQIVTETITFMDDKLLVGPRRQRTPIGGNFLL